jgi:5-methylcytosine-specific restriction enzyme subunit McrC
MNQAFEQWASLRIATMFQQTNSAYKPLFQTQSVWLNDAAGRACLSIRPDLLIYKVAADKGAQLILSQLQNQDDIEVSESESADDYNSGSYSHVIDMKWKYLAHTGAISANDAYQLTSYAQAYHAEQVWLVYPVQDDIRQPIELRQQAYNESTDCHKTPDRQSNPARLWLIPFNVITGKINGGLLPDVNVV